MSNSLSNTPSVSNPVYIVIVRDESDSFPMCHEDVPVLDMDNLLEEPDMILEPIDDELEPESPPYCTQNHGNCSTCSLVNYGLDCQNNRVIGGEVNP